MGKGEIAHYEQFLVFAQCFQKACFPGVSKGVIVWEWVNPLKVFADDNFKFDENGRKLSKPVENTVGKGEIARYEQFLVFPQCFQKACFPGASKGVIVWEWVNPLPNDKYLDGSKLKAFTEDTVNVIAKQKSVLDS